MDEKEFKFEVYANLFIKLVPFAKRINDYTYAGRCVICGDSKRDDKKTRLYLLRQRKKGLFNSTVFCHNCGYSKPSFVFFDDNFHIEYEELKNKYKDSDVTLCPEIFEDVQKRVYIPKTGDELLSTFDKELKLAKNDVGGFIDNYTMPIHNDDQAVQYMRNRFVPEYFIKIMRVLKPEYTDLSKFRYAYFKNYILIPFIDHTDDKGYFFHSRMWKNIQPRSARYLSCTYHPEDSDVKFYFNEMNIDKDKPLIVCEGTISSMNLPNAISTNGIKKQGKEFINYIEHRFGGEKNIIYANDNEMVDEDAKRKTEELLNMGKRVFLWSLMVRDIPKISHLKDFNDICVAAKKTTIPLSTIEKYTVNGKFDKIRMLAYVE